MDEEEKLERVYKVFIRWYAMPQESREPKTIQDFCEHFKIDNSIIAGFQTRVEFTEDLYRASIAWGKSKVPELLHILYAKYKASKNPNDLRMYKDLISDKNDKKKDDTEESRDGILRELFNSTKN